MQTFGRLLMLLGAASLIIGFWLLPNGGEVSVHALKTALSGHLSPAALALIWGAIIFTAGLVLST